MKKLIVAWVLLTLAFIFATGCGTPVANIPMTPNGGIFHWGAMGAPAGVISGSGPLDPVLESRIPANPVNNLQIWGNNFDNSVSYYYSQGTDNHFSRGWNEFGPQESGSQSTYRNESLNITPQPRYRGPFQGGGVVHNAPVYNYHQAPQGQVLQQPPQQRPPDCPPGTIKVQPYPYAR